MTLPAGSVVARDFEVLRTLGSGAMGDVYVVEQRSTGRKRALKLMNASVAASQQARDRFVLEAKVGSRIESEHVVEVVTAGFDAELGAPYLAMELLEGRDLEQRLQEGPLDPEHASLLFRQLGHALSRAHAMGVVHRDLKPANLFLSQPRGESGQAFSLKILDFGIAKLVEAESTAQTQGIGTPLFMAPEQTQARGKVSPATDVWALGLIAYRALAGANFWKARTMAELMSEILFEPIPTATSRAAAAGRRLPPGFDAWFARCVARDPAARFPHAGDAIAALLPLLASPGATQVPVSLAGVGQPAVQVVTGPSPTTASGPAPTPPAPTTKSNLPLILALVALPALGAIGAAVYFLGFADSKPSGGARPGKKEYVEAPPEDTSVPDLSIEPDCDAYVKELTACQEKFPRMNADLKQIKSDLEKGLKDPTTKPLMAGMCKLALEATRKDCAALGAPAPAPANDDN